MLNIRTDYEHRPWIGNMLKFVTDQAKVESCHLYLVMYSAL